MTLDALFDTPATTPPADPTRPVLTIHVVGIPRPQGSKKGFYNAKLGRVLIVDDNKPQLRTWREDVKQAAIDTLNNRPPITAGVEVDIMFLIPRPRSHYGTGRNAHLLRASAPARPTTKPDCDKLLRSSLDALRDAGVYRDDAQVLTMTGRKYYATDHPGAVITIYAPTAN